MKSQKNNMWMKILSVVIAVLIWLFVANTNDPVVTKRFYSIPVKVMNEDALTKRGYAYEILDGEEVNITVKGKSSIVRSMGISDFQAIADFSKLSKVDAVPIDVTAKKYSDQLDITLGTTNTMKITYNLFPFFIIQHWLICSCNIMRYSIHTDCRTNLFR